MISKPLLKFLIVCFWAGIALSGCTENRYLLADKGKDKRFLIDVIKEVSAKGEISKKPMIVVDFVPYRYDVELKNKRLQLTKNDIREISTLKRDIGIETYGEAANGGVLIIKTKSNPY